MGEINPEKIMVMGAGAVGGFFGGKLAQKSNREISLVARGAHLEAIKKNGLHIDSFEGDFTVEGPASDDPEKLPHPGLILFTVKSFDTEQAIRQIAPVVNRGAKILSIQNGIENFPKLLDAFGRENVICGLCRLGARIAGPGIISHTHRGSIIIGEKDGQVSQRVQIIEQAFDDAGVDCRISENIHREIWKKFSWNSIFNMLTAAENKTTDHFYDDGQPLERLWKLADEILQVARAEDVDLRKEDLEKIIIKTGNIGAFITSTLHDRRSGKKLEYDAFTGAMLRLSKKHSIELSEFQELHHQLTEVNYEVV